MTNPPQLTARLVVRHARAQMSQSLAVGQPRAEIIERSLMYSLNDENNTMCEGFIAYDDDLDAAAACGLRTACEWPYRSSRRQ